jgi:UDP-N-acetylglucosamine/UDP-N-acetylgalactosamine diphosphorylase
MAANPVDVLAARGVVIRAPASVELGPEVDPARIAPGVVIHAGCRLRGATTSIGPGCEIGAEAPATLEDCQLGHGVDLKGGYFSGATFLDGASFGSAAHVRPGTLLEEGASCAHAAGLKQTILFPYVTTGSLVNVCDFLMAGGTSRRDHSEIGSSYVHFNFTPHGDKATASIAGDVPRGVFRDCARIFLGGQGGLVGPARIAYGVVIPAGMVWRGDAPEEGVVLSAPPAAAGGARPFVAGAYRSIRRIVRNNLAYVGNLRALAAWYRGARVRFMLDDPYRAACHEGALARIAEGLEERIRRLGELAGRMPRSVELARTDERCALPGPVTAEQESFAAAWPAIRRALGAGFEPAAPPVEFREAWEAIPPSAGLEKALEALPPGARRAGGAWLQSIVDRAVGLWPAAPEG